MTENELINHYRNAPLHELCEDYMEGIRFRILYPTWGKTSRMQHRYMPAISKVLVERGYPSNHCYDKEREQFIKDDKIQRDLRALESAKNKAERRKEREHRRSETNDYIDQLIRDVDRDRDARKLRNIERSLIREKRLERL